MSPEETKPQMDDEDDLEEVQETEEEFDEDELDEDELDEDELNDDEFEYDGQFDIGGLLSATLATEEGDTVCSALVTIGEQLATQNKILLKILTTLSKKDN